jgi:hypothetical protein
VVVLLAQLGELAQLNGSIEKLQCTGIDAVMTAGLAISGWSADAAKGQRKELAERAEKLHSRTADLKKQLEVAIVRCEGEGSGGDGSGGPIYTGSMTNWNVAQGWGNIRVNSGKGSALDHSHAV